MSQFIRYCIAIVVLSIPVSTPIVASDKDTTYTVKVGDTACGIAEQHNIPCARLVKKNNLDSKAMIYPGQVLQLPDSAVWNDSMPCQIRIISWVDVIIQGHHLADKKAEFEKLVRQLFRRNVPSLSHEVKEYGELWSKVSYDETNEEFLNIDVSKDERFIRRAEVNCRVWSSGSESPVALYMQCELSGWGDYNPPTYSEFKIEALDTATISVLPQEAETMLTELLSTIGNQLIKYRERDCPVTLK